MILGIRTGRSTHRLSNFHLHPHLHTTAQQLQSNLPTTTSNSFDQSLEPPSKLLPCSPKPQFFPRSSPVAPLPHPPARRIPANSRGVQTGRQANAKLTSPSTVRLISPLPQEYRLLTPPPSFEWPRNRKPHLQVGRQHYRQSRQPHGPLERHQPGPHPNHHFERREMVRHPGRSAQCSQLGPGRHAEHDHAVVRRAEVESAEPSNGWRHQYDWWCQLDC